MRKRFDFVHCIPSPYRVHLFEEMHRQLKERDVDFCVHYLSDMSRGYESRPLSWRNPKMTFPYRYWRDYGFSHYHFNPGLLLYLRRVRPEILEITPPYDTFTTVLAAWLCPAQVKVTWTEGNVNTLGVLTGWKGWLKRKIFPRYDFVNVSGKLGIEYLDQIGKIAKSKMPFPVMLPNIIDESRFRPREQWAADEIRAMRQELGAVDGERLALVPARYSIEKGLVPFLEKLTPEMLEGWRIVMLGEGPLKKEVEETIKKIGANDRIVLRDFITYEEMPKAYAASDLFILPSIQDANPLSVVEALHSGLAVAVSDMAGNVSEAVSQGKNGWVLHVRNSALFREELRQVFSTDIDSLREMGRVSKSDNAQYWDTRKCVTRYLTEIGAL